MTGYSTLDISGLQIVNEKRRNERREYNRQDCDASPVAGNVYKKVVALLLMLAVAIAVGAGVFNSTLFASYRVEGSGAPQEIMEFVDSNPEAAPFALNWEKYHNKSQGISIDSEVKKGTCPLFIQWDKRWGYRTYGGGQFLGITGCGPTCLSMVYSGLTGETDMNPYKMAKFSEDHGYYVKGTGTAWTLMSDGASELGLKSKRLNSQKALLKALSNGHPVIASMSAGDFTKSGHFILMTGLSDSGEICINDPNSPANSRKTWDVDRVYPQIKAMWSFS